MELVIDPGFKSQLFPLSPAEFAFLESSILEEGCREQLVVWSRVGELPVLIDGHNRYEICTKHDLEFSVMELEFGSRDEVEEWIDINQAGRRNCNPDDYKIITGRIYNRRKKRDGERGDGKKLHQVEVAFSSTAEQVGSELGISKATVERNGQRAEVFDKMQSFGDSEAAEAAKTLPQKDIVEVKDKPPEEAAKVLKEKHVHVAQNSGNNEWYTPPEFIRSAKTVLGEIDLDPASSPKANEIVGAKRFFTADDDGRSAKWKGRVWMNPPYAQPLIAEFCQKLIDEVASGRVTDAIVLVNNATDTQWWQSISGIASSVCFPKGRVRFLDPNGNPGAPLQGQAILYVGERKPAFVSEFSKYGVCF